jgi:TPR repeat protein
MTRLLHIALISLAATCAGAGGAYAASPTADDSELRQKMVAANWPADIVRLADQVLHSNPSAAWAADDRRRAETTMRALRNNDVALYRNAFQADLGSVEQNLDLHRAALGDPVAAQRIAGLYKSGSPAVAPDSHRYIGWMQLAAKLGNEGAAYELALHFRREGQPLLAASYETRAINLGYSPPSALDHARK